MANMLICEGTFTPPEYTCDGIIQIVEYVEPADVNALQVLLESLLSTPSEAEIQQAFMVGFSLPLIAYLTAWAYQTVINFIGR